MAQPAAQTAKEFWADHQKIEYETAFIRKVVLDFGVTHVLLNDEWSPFSDLTTAEGVWAWLSNEKEVAQLRKGALFVHGAHAWVP